jgi:Cellulose biosynthesis protein BcsS
MRDGLQVKVCAGVDVKYDLTFPYDPSNRLYGLHLGARTAINVWFEPSPQTMLAADASLSSIIASYSARLALGWRPNERWFYIGPEAASFACIGFTQARAGVHATALRTGEYEWSAAAGWAEDSERRSGLYVRLGLLTRR